MIWKSMKTNKRLYIAILTFLLLIIARDNLSIPVPQSVFSGAAFACALLLDAKSRVVLPCVLLPFCRGLPYSEILLIVLAVSVLLRIKSLRFCAKYYLPIMAIVVIEMLDYMKFHIFSNEILYLMIYMLFVTYVIEQGLYQGMEKRMILLYSCSAILSVIIVVLREIQLLGFDYIMTYNVRFGANTNGLMVTNYNSNELGLYCCVAAALLLLLYHNEKKLSYLILAVISSAIGFTSISRSFMLVLAVAWGFYFLYEKKSIKNIILWLAMIVLAAVVVSKCFPDISHWILRYYKRRNLEASIDGFGGRVAIASVLFQGYFSSLWSVLFGFSEEYAAVLGTGAAHNGLQEMLISWGAIGFLISLSWIFMLMHRVKTRCRRSRWKNYTPFMVFFVYVQTIQLFTMHNYLILMMISMVAAAGGGENETSGILLDRQFNGIQKPCEKQKSYIEKTQQKSMRRPQRAFD